MSAGVVETGPAPRYLTGADPELPGGWGDLDATGALLGRPLRPWQSQLADVALQRNGRWRWPLVTVTVPRQSGKTTLAGVLAVDRCLKQPGAQVWSTAQSRVDATLRLGELAGLLRASMLRGWWEHRPPKPDDAGAWDYRLTVGSGNEAIAFPNGSIIRVFAPREDSLHGSTTDLVIIDEARFFPAALGAALLAAALPTQVTRDGQVWITSTAGGPSSTWLAQLCEQGRASTADLAARNCYAEWQVPAVDDDQLLEAVWEAHPAAGLEGGPQRAAVELAHAVQPSWQFAHEYGNRWSSEDAARLIPAARWEATFTNRDLLSPLTLAVDVAPDRQSSCVVACGDGVLEVVCERPGADWVADEVRRLVAVHGPEAVVVDSGGPAGTVAEQLRGELDVLVEPKIREVTAACGLLFDGLAAGTVTHRAHPGLDDAAAHAARRAAGGSWTFARAAGGHLVMAAALAAWGAGRPATAEGWFVA